MKTNQTSRIAQRFDTPQPISPASAAAGQTIQRAPVSSSEAPWGSNIGRGVQRAAAEIASKVVDQVRTHRSPGAAPFKDRYVDRSGRLREVSFPVWQIDATQSASASALEDVRQWAAIEHAAERSLTASLPADLKVVDVQVRSLVVRRDGTSVAYRVTLGAEDAEDKRRAPVASFTDAVASMIAARRGDTGVDGAASTIADVYGDIVRVYQKSAVDQGEVPFGRAYTDRDAQQQETPFDVWQSSTTIGLNWETPSTALTQGGRAWDRVEAQAKALLQDKLTEDLQVMDVQVLGLERRRIASSVEVQVTIRRAGPAG